MRKQALITALKSAGYPDHAEATTTNVRALIGLISCLNLFVGRALGPLGAWLAEMFYGDR